jgi:hypothetical protein
LEGIAEVCHRRGKPLIVDEAWGAHLPFHPDLPTWAMDASADVCVVSVHKMGGGFEQGSVFHHQGDLVEWPHLAACADLLMTTSPSVPIYAALDGWRHQMVDEGQALLQSALQLSHDVRGRIDALPGLRVLDSELRGHEASHDLDRLQILIDVSELGITGYQAADWMRDTRHLDVGMADHRRTLATLSIADDVDTADRLITALTALTSAAAEMEDPPQVAVPSPTEIQLDTVGAPPCVLRSRLPAHRSRRGGLHRRRTAHPLPAGHSRGGARRAAQRCGHRLSPQRAGGRNGDPGCHRPQPGHIPLHRRSRLMASYAVMPTLSRQPSSVRFSAAAMTARAAARLLGVRLSAAWRGESESRTG